MHRRALALSLSSVLFLIVGCTGVIPGYDPNDPMKVTVTSPQYTIMPGATLQLTATVTGDGPLTVQWSVDGIVGGSSTSGTVSATGLYTAPAAVSTDLPVAVTATSTANPSALATVTILVQAPTITSVAVTCSPASILTTGASNCTATVNGTGNFSSAVTWSAVGGTITSAGVFTPSAAGSATVTATSVQDATRFGSTSVAVAVPPAITSVSATCLPSPILVSQTSNCTASVAGVGAYNPSVTWSATGGSITPAGVFTASVTGNATITATSVQDSTRFASTTVAVATTPAISSVSVTCQPSPILVSQTSNCTASVAGVGAYNPAVTWSATGGSITPAGVFTASATGNATITATSVEDTTKFGSDTVSVAVPPAITSVSVSCSPSTILASQSSVCTANVTGTGAFSSSVTWTVDNGSIDQTGKYTAPANAVIANIKAVSNEDPTKYGTATVTVNAGPTITSVTMNCETLVVPVGQTAQCTATVAGTGAFNSGVAWEVNGEEGGDATIGFISASGLYQAPATAPNPYVVVITAASVEDATKSAWVSLRIQGPISSSTQTIGPAGGTITLADGNSVVIPAGVLQTPTAVTLSSSSVPIQPTNTLFQGIGPSLSLSFNPAPSATGLVERQRQRLLLSRARPMDSSPSSSSALTFIVNGDPTSSAAQIQGAFGIADVNDGTDNFYSLPSTYNSTMNQTTLAFDPSLVTASSTVQVGLTEYLECAVDSAKLEQWDTSQNKFVDAAPGTCQAGPKTLVMISGMNSCPNGTFNAGDNLAAKAYASTQPNYSGSIYAIEYPWTFTIDVTAKSVGTILENLVGANCSATQSFDIIAYSEGVVVGLDSLGASNLDAATRTKLGHFISVAGPINGTPLASDFDDAITEIMNEIIPGAGTVGADLLGYVDKGDFSGFVSGLTPTSTTIANAQSAAELATNTKFDAFGGDQSCTFLWGLISETDLIFAGAPNDCVVAVSSSLPQNLSFISPLNEYEFTDNHVNLVNNSTVVPVILAALNDTAPDQNYSLSTSPSTFSVTAGSGGAFQLTATSTGGFSGTVTISSFDSSGISGSCSPASVSVSSGNPVTTNCSFTTSSGTSAGTYPITIQTSSGSLTQNTSITVVVTAANPTVSSVNISPSPVTSGSSAQVTVTLTGPAPSGGASISLSSTNTTAFPVVGFNIAAGQTSNSAGVQAGTVTSATIATVTASYNNSSQQTTVTVDPVAPGGNYTISPSPSTINVTAGNPGSLVLTAASSNGFAGTVTLSPISLSGISGANGSWTSSSIALTAGAQGTSTYSFSTTTGTPAGTYQLAIQTSSGSLTQNTSVTVVVTAAGTPSYSASMSGSGQSINAGGSAQFSLTATSVNGFSNTVSLPQASMSISGANSSWSPSSISITPSAQGISTLTVSTSTNTPAGTYTIVENMPNGQSPSVTLTVTSGSSGTQAPTATTGSASAVTTSSATLLGTVNPNGSDTHFYFEYGTSNTLSSYGSTGTQDLGAGTSASGISANIASLNAGTQYYFRVVAYNSYGTTMGSIVPFSTTSAQTAPTAHFTMTGQSQTVSDPNTLNLTVTTGGSVAVTLNSTSTQGSAPITSYVWEFNGTQQCSNSSSCSVNVTGSGNGTFTLTVTDSNSKQSTATAYVYLTVSNPTPTITNISPNSFTLGQGGGVVAATITGTGFTSESYQQYSVSGGAQWAWATVAPWNISSTSMTIDVNTGTAETQLWRVCASYGSTVCSGSVTVTVTNPPAPDIYTVTSPIPGSTTTLEPLTITGTNFSTAAAGGYLEFTDTIGNTYLSTAHPERIASSSATQWVYDIDDNNDPGTWHVQMFSASGQPLNIMTFVVQ